jgi:hypothetical protein
MDFKTKIKDEFRTSDLFLVTYLTLKRFTLLRKPYTKLNNTRYVIFAFEKTEELKQAVDEFMNRKVMVEPMSLLETYRTVKTLAWDGKKAAEEAKEEMEVSHE